MHYLFNWDLGNYSHMDVHRRKMLVSDEIAVLMTLLRLLHHDSCSLYMHKINTKKSPGG